MGVGTWVGARVGIRIGTSVGTCVGAMGTWVEPTSDVHATPANSHRETAINDEVRMRARILLSADFSAVCLGDTGSKNFFPRLGLIATPTFTGRPESATIIDQGTSTWQTSGCGSARSVP